MKDKILVIGGTGKTGRKVVKKLQNKGIEVRIGSRSASPSFDWQKPQGWAAALAEMDKVYITFQPDLAVPGAKEAIEQLVKESQKAGIKKLVLLSGKGEREAELCEQIVINSGIAYTIIRASWFSQNFSESFFLEPIQAGHVATAQADAQIPFVDTDDISDVALEVLLSSAHDGQLYELTGARSLSFKEVVAEIAEVTGREIAFTPVSLEAYRKMLEEAGVPADYVWLVNYLFAEVIGDPAVSEISHDIEKVLGRKPKDFSTYVTETAATGIWNPKIHIPSA
ncbi:MAG: NAD(P)H-binding protein [Bacteroidia bacterium]|nr:NAD(P)H-binding protein [Bacteroidia bacterium]